jgi:hypothetical protein
LNIVRQRKLEARAHRQEILHPTAEKTIIQVPQPKNLIVNKAKNKSPEIAEPVKRGRGRPPKSESDKNKVKMAISKTATVAKKHLTGKKEKK